MIGADSRVGSVPSAANPLLGRLREIAQLRELLTRTRLLTLTGAAGTGKTRLALELSKQATEDGADVAFVDLAAVREPEGVLPAIARALGLRQTGGQTLEVTLHREVGDAQLLVVLDNFEHVLDAVPQVVTLLSDCPGLRVLTTSRAALQAPGERQFAVEPLPVPDLRRLPPPAELAQIDSVALFLDRARAAAAELDLNADNARTVAEICLALDGLPLALELAAAQVRAYGIDEVLARTRSRLRLLTAPRRAVIPRHRSLANALRWSVELLDEPTERLFRALSVFADGWGADSAQQVCGESDRDVLPELASLVDQSLVVATPSARGVRYRMLETVREYATSLLDDSAERAEQHHRLLSWCHELARAIGTDVFGADEADALDKAERELENISAALDGSNRSDTGLALSTAALLYRFWDTRGYLGRGREHLERLLCKPAADLYLTEQAAGWGCLGMLLLWQDEHTHAQEALARGVEIAERLGETDRIASALSSIVISRFMTDAIDDTDDAARAVTLARATGSSEPLGRALCALGLLRWAQGNRQDGVAALQEALEVTDTAGSAWGRGKLTYFLGWCAYLDGDRQAARRYQTASAATFRQLADVRSLPDSLDVLGCLDVQANEHASALGLFTAAQRLRSRAGSRRHAYLRPYCQAAEQTARSVVGNAHSAHIVEHIHAVALDHIADETLADTTSPGSTDLTPRETAVADLVVEGLSNRVIARRLNISERTVDRHLENIRTKLGVQTRAQVAAWVAGQSLAARRPARPS